jgi:hypothetical protein
MLEYKTKVKTEELVYEFDEGVLTLTSVANQTQTSVTLDLSSTLVNVSLGKGWPGQMPMFIIGLMICFCVCGYMGTRDWRRGDSVGIIAAAIVTALMLAISVHQIIKGRKNWSYLSLKTRQKGGINILCPDPEYKEDFDEFAQEILAFIETNSPDPDDPSVQTSTRILQ